MTNITVIKDILSANDQVALENRSTFDQSGIFTLNLMASPGAGKTSTILATTDHLDPTIRPGVIGSIPAAAVTSTPP